MPNSYKRELSLVTQKTITALKKVLETPIVSVNNAISTNAFINIYTLEIISENNSQSVVVRFGLTSEYRDSNKGYGLMYAEELGEDSDEVIVNAPNPSYLFTFYEDKSPEKNIEDFLDFAKTECLMFEQLLNDFPSMSVLQENNVATTSLC